MTTDNLSIATTQLMGAAKHPGYNSGRPGVPLAHTFSHDYGAIGAKGAELIIKDATSTQLPNNSTKTYTADTDGTDPLDATTRLATASVLFGTDGTLTVWVIPTPRTIAVATSSAAFDTVVTVTGYDEYKVKTVETITIAAASSAGTGLKAFKWIRSIAIYSAGDITTDTIDVGTSDVIGIPYAALTKNHFTVKTNGAEAADTKVAAVATTATATTGDVRGTFTPTNVPDGSTYTYMVFIDVDNTTEEGAYGVAQYSG